jgi:septal ring-binding cell division protein DamX
LKRTTLRAATVFLLIFAAHASATAQTRGADAPARDARRTEAQTQPESSSTADEDFELNIDLRRISESDFHAETAVSTDGTRGLRLNVGVELLASDIVVTLRNVRGRVRFRASLDPVLRLLDARRNAAPPSQPARTPP